MVTAAIKVAIATQRLSDKKERRELEPGTERSTDEDEDLQNLSVEEDYDK